MITVFERIPDFFVELYDEQFQVWSRELRKRGYECAIVFDLPDGVAPLLNENGQPMWRGCWLRARIERRPGGFFRMIIRPRTEEDEELIRRHCSEMRPFVLH
jgi:hypothetical protein